MISEKCENTFPKSNLTCAIRQILLTKDAYFVLYIDEIFGGFDQNRRGITVKRPTLDQLVQVKVDFEGARGAKFFFSFFHFISCQTPPSGHNKYYKYI